MSIEKFVSDQLVKREARGRSPSFRAEMAKENAEFSSILNGLGDNAYDAGVTALLKTPTNLFLNSLKLIYSKNYTLSQYTKDAFQLFIGKNGVAHETLKVAANAIHLAGQGAKIGVRHLFKL